jgi:hypothetical protein
MFAGAGLGIAAQGFLALVIIRYAIPLFGLDLLDMARAVAAFDLPARAAQLAARFLALKETRQVSPFLHFARNSLRALPCKPCASALAEHSLASADMGAFFAFGIAGAAGAVGAGGAAGGLACICA